MPLSVLSTSIKFDKNVISKYLSIDEHYTSSHSDCLLTSKTVNSCTEDCICVGSHVDNEGHTSKLHAKIYCMAYWQIPVKCEVLERISKNKKININ